MNLRLQVIYHTTQGEVVDNDYFTGYDSQNKLHAEIMNYFEFNKKENENPVIFYDDENFNLVSIPQEIITGIEIREVK